MICSTDIMDQFSERPTTNDERPPYGTKWGCSRARILLETAESEFWPSCKPRAPRLTGGMSPKKKSNGKSGKTSDILIPEKLYFRIGEVARLCRLPAYVLRFWETEFPQLKPVKSSTGLRMYRRRDVESVVRIKQLLYEGVSPARAPASICAMKARVIGSRWRFLS